MRCTFCLHDPDDEREQIVARKLDELAAALATLRTDIMTAISDFAAQQKTFNDDIAADLTAIQGAIATLNTTITNLQNSQGTVSPEDQALIDDLVTQGTALAAQADTTAGKTPPAPPPAAAPAS